MIQLNIPWTQKGEKKVTRQFGGGPPHTAVDTDYLTLTLTQDRHFQDTI